MRSLRERWRTWAVPVGLALLLFGGKFMLIRSHGTDVPHWDPWIIEGELLFKPWVEGNLEIGSLFTNHNEHRPFFTRIWALGIFVLNDQWDSRLEAVANAFLHVASALLLFHLLRPLFRGWLKPAFLLLLVLFFALPFNWENTLRGFQSQFAFLLLFTLVYLQGSLNRKPLSPGWWLAQAAGCATLLTAGSGFVAAAVLVAVVAFRAFALRAGTRADWATVAVAAFILIAGVLLRVPAPWHDDLRPETVIAFLHSLSTLLAWPFPFFLVAPLMMAPIILLILKARSLSIESGPILLVIALGLWTWIQTLGLAYTRGGVALGYSSRYGDLLAIGVIASGAALAVLLSARPDPGRTRFLSILAVSWALLAVGGVGYRSYWGERQHLKDLKRIQSIQISLIRDFIVNGDPSVLKDKPFLHIPFPDADRLAGLLSDPTIRSILPVSIRPTVQVAADDFSTHGFVANGVPAQTHAKPLEASWGSYTDKGAAQQGYFRSQPIESDLPMLSMTIAGTFSLEQENMTLIGLNSTEIVQPMISTVPGVRFMTLNTFRPDGAFALSVADPSSETWIAISNPAGLGFLSWLAKRASKLGLELMMAGAVLMLVPIGLDIRDRPRQSEPS